MPWKKMFIAFKIFVIFVLPAGLADTGSVDVATYYPSSDATYPTLLTTGTTTIATDNSFGRNVGIGTAAPGNIGENDAGGAGVDLNVTGTIVQEPWTNIGAISAPAFQGAWANYPGATWNQAGFFRDKSGIVHLKGLIRSGVVPSTVFNLPAGYRPAREEHFFVLSHNNLNYIDGLVVVSSAGAVSVDCGASANFVSLDGISFRANGY